MRGLVLAALLAAAIAAPADAQSPDGRRRAPIGAFCALAPVAATGLASCPGFSAGVPQNISMVLICTNVQGIVWRDDGSAPTATPGTGGQGLASGACLSYFGNFNAIQIIQQSSAAQVGVTFYQ